MELRCKRKGNSFRQTRPKRKRIVQQKDQREKGKEKVNNKENEKEKEKEPEKEKEKEVEEMEKEKEMEKEAELVDMDAEDSKPARKHRGKSWSWHANFTFLKIMHKVGVNWGKILHEMHARHLATECTLPAQMRERWKVLSKNNSCVWKKDWPGKKWDPRSVPKGTSKDAMLLLEERHAEAVAKRECQMKRAQDWIHKIKAREVVLDSEKALNTQELLATAKSVNDQRRAQRDHRLKLSEEMAARESKCQEAVISLAPTIAEMAAHANRMEQMMAEYLGLRTQLLRAKLMEHGQSL